MSRLDDLYEELQGTKPKSSKSNTGVSSTKIEVRQDPSTSNDKKDPAVTVTHRDLGTKKDPTKLRPRVTHAGIKKGLIDDILKAPQ